MAWLRLVGSSKLQVSFADYSLFYRALLQKKSTISRRLLIVGTPQASSHGHAVLLTCRASDMPCFWHAVLLTCRASLPCFFACMKANYVHIFVCRMCVLLVWHFYASKQRIHTYMYVPVLWFHIYRNVIPAHILTYTHIYVSICEIKVRVHTCIYSYFTYMYVFLFHIYVRILISHICICEIKVRVHICMYSLLGCHFSKVRAILILCSAVVYPFYVHSCIEWV